MTNPEYLQDKIQSIIQLYSNNEVHEALEQIELLIDQYPNDALLHNLNGACYASLDELDKAISCYNIALTINPNYAEAYWKKGELLLIIKKEKILGLNDADLH